MSHVLETGAATTAASMLVSLFKHAWPTAPSGVVVFAAIVAGVGGSILATVSEHDAMEWDQGTVATVVLQGIIAAGAAAGLYRAEKSAEAKRDAAKLKRAAAA